LRRRALAKAHATSRLSQFQLDVARHLGGLVGRQDLACLTIEHHATGRPRVGGRSHECSPQRQKVAAETEGERLRPTAAEVDVSQVIIVEEIS
jgi:hypothetical protein